MKKIKYIFSMIFVLCLCVTGIIATSTGVVIDPGWTPGVTARGSTYNLTSSAYTVRGDNVGVIYSELGFLEDYYARGDRDFPLWLYEEDYTGDDDLVKTYEVYFDYDYTNILYVSLISTNDAGEIDASGDNQGEFYLSGEMERLSGDSSISTHLFYYNIILN